MLKTLDFKGRYEAIADTFSSRKEEISKQVNDAVMDIIDDVKENGDKAILNYCAKFDGFEIDDPSKLIVSKKEIMEGVTAVGKDFIRIIERTKEQLIEFHKNQVDKSWSLFKDNGVIMGQMVRPIERVALYVPGGTATYPSTVMMNAIPAKLAGVKEVVIITPVKSDGKVNPAILAAAYVCGIETIYKVGGAQGVAAVAVGTKTIKKVDKIVGPGNIYVATAKKCCYGMVDIDMIAGPSEILIVADKNANPKYIAADLMSQAEHDRLASAILVTTAPELLDDVNKELERQMAYLSRTDIIKESLENYGGAIIVDNIKEAFDVSNYFAPEHLEVLVDNPVNTLPLIKNAGSIFLGEYTPEPLGDYMSGTNHVLPTGGTAKFYSALGVYDYVKYSSYSYYPKNVLATFKDDVEKFAKLEGLDAHANSITVRFEED
ncbi:MAG: histidinol dehydrogenase [Bacilli bacterium]|nr:histidinol dehydrogenase [Bacilli bacterium]